MDALRQRPLGGALDVGAVGDGVGEGNADLDGARAHPGETPEHLERELERGIAGGNEGNQPGRAGGRGGERGGQARQRQPGGTTSNSRSTAAAAEGSAGRCNGTAPTSTAAGGTGDR